MGENRTGQQVAQLHDSYIIIIVIVMMMMIIMINKNKHFNTS